MSSPRVRFEGGEEGVGNFGEYLAGKLRLLRVLRAFRGFRVL